MSSSQYLPSEGGDPNGLVISVNDPNAKPAGQSSFALGQLRADSRSQSNVLKSQSVSGMNEIPSAGQATAMQSGDEKHAAEKQASMHSFGSGSSSAAQHGKELVETPYFKMKGTKWNWFSLANNVILLVVFLELTHSEGLFFNIGPDMFTQGGPVIFHVWMHILHFISHQAVNEALANIIGYMMSRPRGYSLAACGFAHADIFTRITYPGLLSYKSKIKKFLTYVVYFSIVHSAILACTILASTSIYPEVMRTAEGELSCIVYREEGEIVDRGFPTLEVAVGSAEFAFGTAIGKLRAEEPGLKNTYHIFPPQLTDKTANEHEIIGEGFVTNVLTNCECSKSMSEAHLITAGISKDAVGPMRSLIFNGTAPSYLIQNVRMSGDSVIVESILTGTNVCGGTNNTNPRLPVCNTKFSNHIHADIEVHFASADAEHETSVAIDKLLIYEKKDPADISWVYRGLLNLFEGRISKVPMFQVAPGSTSPLLWWTTTNLQSVSASILEPGLEATYSILNRAAMQRSLSTEATKCTETIIISTQIKAHMSYFGETFGLIFVGGLLLTNILCIAAAIPWFMSSNPIHPAIRLAGEPTYFSFMVVSHLTPAITQGVSYAQNVMEVWPKLDNTIRVGEAIHTKDDPEYGKIAIDKPKMVTNFVIGKQYM